MKVVPETQQPDGSASEELQSLLTAVNGVQRKDAEAWYRLGIAYNRVGINEEARRAFEHAINLRKSFPRAHAGLAYTYFVEKQFDKAWLEARRAYVLDNYGKDSSLVYRVLSAVHLQYYRDACAVASAQADRELAAKPDDPEWLLLKAAALIGLSVGEQRLMPDLSEQPVPDKATLERRRADYFNRFKEAERHLSRYFSLAPNKKDSAYWREQLDALRAHIQAEEEGGAGGVHKAADVTTKAQLINKPEPGFTDAARDNNVNGIVKLRLMLADDGKVKHILVIKPVGYGLTERAIDAARRIKFKPAVKDGRPVSQWVMMEYNFNVY